MSRKPSVLNHVPVRPSAIMAAACGSTPAAQSAGGSASRCRRRSMALGANPKVLSRRATASSLQSMCTANCLSTV
eukprot:6211036-Lingulodinium_polyedra.AAC.1